MKHLLLVLSLVGCATPGFREQMMADGNTWHITYGIDSAGLAFTWPGCEGMNGGPECVNAAEPKISKRALELCSQEPHRIFACGVLSSSHLVSCNVQCKQNPKHEIEMSKDSTPGKAEVNQEISTEVIKKAKKCQSKGGVWINDSCQLDVDSDSPAH